MNREAWWATVHGFTKSQTQLSDCEWLTLLVHTIRYYLIYRNELTRAIYNNKFKSYKLMFSKWSKAQNNTVSFHLNKIQKKQHYSILTRDASVQFSRSVVSDSLRSHEPQHARPPCPSPTPGLYPNSWPLSRWCHPIISSSVVPFSSCPQSFPASGSFPMSQLFTSGGQSTGVSASASVLPMNIQDWFPLGSTGWISLQSKGLSRVFSNTTVQKHQFFVTQLSL